MTFTVNGATYKTNDNGNYFYKSTDVVDKKGNVVFKRVSQSVYEQAMDEWIRTNADNADADAWEAEEQEARQAREERQAESDKVAEDAINKKKAKKARRSKDIAFESNGVTLTTKQVRFLQRMSEDCFFENGVDSKLWIDVYCETVADEFNPMAVGAMVSTLREKGLISVAQDRVNGKKCKWMMFTETGKQVAKELGLN
jgi:hypothetical protein